MEVGRRVGRGTVPEQLYEDGYLPWVFDVQGSRVAVVREMVVRRVRRVRRVR